VIRSNFEDSELTAPVSGRVVKCFLSQNNQSIQKGDTLLVITTELLNTQQQLVNTQQQDYNAQLQHLIAECLVSPKDIGFIHPSQNVRFQIDTYNYNQWGLLNGSVKEIDKNLVVNEQTGEGLFKIRCGINKGYLQLKNGYRGNIGKGMSFTARFYLTNRTLWQLLFDRADDWFNPNLT